MTPDPRLVPLSLYVHLPWCLRKCPYCDFNSHAVKEPVPQHAYVDALLADLHNDIELTPGRPLQTIFIGGGTPSLFEAAAIGRLLEGIAAAMPMARDTEITLEANPGALDNGRLAGFRSAGVNRLSIGVQSFAAGQLELLGRIHGRDEAIAAVHAARAAGFDNINLDLMYALPQQDLALALADVEQAMALEPEHISLYQLTIEPNTLFHHRPPPLPDDEGTWSMQQALLERLERGGYRRYEISAYARDDLQCRHNLNYWTFGDYLGIGAGAHAKVTTAGGILRRHKARHPATYLAGDYLAGETRLDASDRVIEFAMNALRLVKGVPLELFRERTGLPAANLESARRRAVQLGLLDPDPQWLRPTTRGLDFLNDLTGLFLGDSRIADAV